jgi:hypothetical protein
VDLRKMTHNQFAGKRASALPAYSLKGWALGINNGNIVLVVDDGENRSHIGVHFSASSFDRGGWNHIAGVRDKSKGELRLYVNGREAAPPVKDQTRDLSNTEPFRIGYDTYAGVFLNGLMDEVKITKKAVPAEDITNKYLHLIGK